MISNYLMCIFKFYLISAVFNIITFNEFADITDLTCTVVAPLKLRPKSEYRLTISDCGAIDPIELDVTIHGITRNRLAKSVNKTVVVDSSDTMMYSLDIGDWTQGQYKLLVQARGRFNFRDDKALLFEKKSCSVFIQTDKPIYKAGQVVQFRVLVLNPSLQPNVSDANLHIQVKDADANLIKQWNVVYTSRNIVSQDLQLSDQPVLGDWIIYVTVSEESFHKSFTVIEYVLPTFDVQVLLPSYVTPNKSDIITTVKAMYTNGKPVKGELEITVGMSETAIKLYQNINGSVDISLNIIRDLNLNAEDFDTNKFTQIPFVAVVKDCLSGHTLKDTNMLTLHAKEFRLELLRYKKTYKPGLKFSAIIKVTEHDYTPVENNVSEVTVRYRFANDYEVSKYEPELKLIPNKGYIIFNINPPKFSEKTLFIKAEYHGQSYKFDEISSAESTDGNYIQISMKNHKVVNVGESITFEINATEPLNRITYEVMSAGNIISAKSITINNKTAHEFNINVTQPMAPKSKIIVYYMRKERRNIISDVIDFDVESVFQTPVKISTNVNSTLPGTIVEVRIETTADSIVAVSAIDQSLLSFGTGNDITEQDVINEIKTYSEENNYFQWSTSEGIFHNSGFLMMKGLSDELIYERFIPGGYVSDDMNFDGEIDTTQNIKSQNTVKIRNRFPETLLWNTTIASENGIAIFTSSIPDTITSWVINAFAIDKVTGLGIAAKPGKVTVFRNFFIRLSLPYSIVRGENIKIQAIVYNYFDNALNAEVYLENNEEAFEFTHIGTETNNTNKNKKLVSIPANDGVEVVFEITPKIVGYIDIKITAITLTAGDSILKKLSVKPNGWTKKRDKTIFVYLKESNKAFNKITENISISIPNYSIAGSERVSITGIGNILGFALNNINNLLQIPSGCGEQNMVKFVPNIVVLSYLNNTKRLIPRIKFKAINNIEIGYQNVLTYKHKDGSFSFWGNAKNGCTWLTAFVLKSFIQAKSHIDIDEKVINESIVWLFNQQNIDGSFREVGYVSEKLQGGLYVSQNALTAYVVIAILHHKKFNHEKQISKAVTYIWNQFPSVQNTYDIVIMTNALHLANSENRENAFQQMMGNAKRNSEHLWWTLRDDTTDYNHDSDLSNSIDIEMNGYALMTLTLRNDITNAVPLLRWIISKQNSNGGFCSTQDTVIAIQALGSAAQMFFTSISSLDIEFRYKTIDKLSKKEMNIDNYNALLLQTIEMPVSTEYVEIEVTGFGVAVIQISFQYNLDLPEDNNAFSLKAQFGENSNEDHLLINVCTHYNDGSATTMAVIEVELPSGYVGDKNKILDLNLGKQITRIDEESGRTKFNIYFNSITKDEICLTVPAERRHLVTNTQPFTITVFEYSKRQNVVTKFFNSSIPKKDFWNTYC